MADAEEYFPRGGKKPTGAHFKQSGNFLGVAEKAEKKKKKPKKKSEGDDGYLSDEAQDYLKTHKLNNNLIFLSSKSLRPGINLLGRVIHVSDVKIKVSMPCKLLGNVMACHISESYNKLLEAYVEDKTEKVRELSQMFKPGQYIAVSVVELAPGNTMLTTMPQHVNSGKRHTDIKKGAIFQAAVSSVEDHGYVMDLGIPNTTAFLPKKDANPEIDLDTGMVCWCAVKSVKQTADSSVVALGAAPDCLQAARLQHKPDSQLLPGNALHFTVDSAVDNGVKGFVFDDVQACVLRQHLDKGKAKRPAVGQKVTARVLFVMPPRNMPYLTLKNVFETTYPDLEQERKYKDGDIIEEAQVLKITGRSVHMKLDHGCTAVMSIKRIDIEEEMTDEEVIAKSYPVGSTHRVRVLNYNLSDYFYSVTDDPSVVNEKYFTMEQLSVGEIVDGHVKTVTDSYILVSLGRIHGYVGLNHLTDAGVLLDPRQGSNPKLTKKFKVGQQVRARVLSVDPAKPALMLTLKPSLLAADLDVLQRHDQAVIGKVYTGVIYAIRDYILVSFFNNLMAYVPKTMVSIEPIENLTEAFHVGQIVSCTILNVDVENKKLLGSLIPTQTFRINRKRKAKEKHDSIGEEKETEDEGATQINEEEDKPKNKQTLASGDAPDKQKKKKKDNRVDGEMNGRAEGKTSEESDAIDTDLSEECEQVLTPEDLALLDLSQCRTKRQYKKRIDSILNAVSEIHSGIPLLEEKIAKIEAKGLTTKNKMLHTALHSEKLINEERANKLNEGLETARRALADLRAEPHNNHTKQTDDVQPEVKENIENENIQKKIDKKRKANKERKNSKDETEIRDKKRKGTDDVRKTEDSKTDQGRKARGEPAEKRRTVNVTEELRPVLHAPSARDFWSGTLDSGKTLQDQQSSSSDDEEKEQPKKKRKKLSVAEKLAKAREEEERLREMEKRAIESDAQPRSADHFQRALLANPSASQLWIAYMAFHLQATEIEKARAVARKALSTICFREEDEKLNVWLALINLENRFGTKESQQKTLEEALQMNDTFKVHSKLLDIYVDTGKQQELSALVDLMLRKYKRDPKTYTLCGTACYKLNLKEKARYVMQKALNVLEKKEHVQVLVQFALLERDRGERERAEALLEQVLAVYPQRVDVCAVYVDMLVKENDIERVRQVMERITSHQLPARKMKVLYKKWIEVEEKIGDEGKAEIIRQRAIEYVEKAKF